MTALVTCSVEACDRPVNARGWCAAHYLQWRKTGATTEAPIRRYARSLNLTTCAVDDCDRPQYARGWCRTHYARWTRTGSAHLAVRICSVDGCDERGGYKGYCAFHGRRVRMGIPVDAPRYGVIRGACAVEGCERSSATRRGWCRGHYDRWSRTGDVGPAEIRRWEPIAAGTTCQLPGCTREVVTRGWCNRHYKRVLDGRDVTAERPTVVADFRQSIPAIQADLPCASDGCHRRARSRGLCQAHYHQQRRLALRRTA